MTPEQREQMRERRAAMGGGGPRNNNPEGPATRTVYTLETDTANEKEKPIAKVSGLLPSLVSGAKQSALLKPVTIKTGISDGTFTEVLDGLNEGDTVVTGLNLPAGATTTMRPPGGSPFGGPFGGGGMRPR